MWGWVFKFKCITETIQIAKPQASYPTKQPTIQPSMSVRPSFRPAVVLFHPFLATWSCSLFYFCLVWSISIVLTESSFLLQFCFFLFFRFWHMFVWVSKFCFPIRNSLASDWQWVQQNVLFSCLWKFILVSGTFFGKLFSSSNSLF